LFLLAGSRLRCCLTLALPLLLLSPCVAHADPGYYVVTAYDNAGVATVDFRYWTVKANHSGPATLWLELGLGYGVTSRWYTEVFASTIGAADTSFKPSTWNWQNEFLLTQGELPVDIAAHLALIKHHDADDGTTIEYGPVLQTDLDRIQLNANLFFEHSYGATGDYATHATLMKYQWQARYRWRPALQFGVQGFGELGPWDRWSPGSQQSHRAGPALFGSVKVGGNGQALLYQAAYLVGSTYAQNGNMFSMRVQYAF
jgi:hypothetical protein